MESVIRDGIESLANSYRDEAVETKEDEPRICEPFFLVVIVDKSRIPAQNRGVEYHRVWYAPVIEVTTPGRPIVDL